MESSENRDSSNQPERCPLCGWQPHPQFSYRACIPCGLPLMSWSRIAELVADNTRLQEWEQRAVASMDAACKAVGVECCDQIPERVAELVAIRDAVVRCVVAGDQYDAGVADVTQVKAAIERLDPLARAELEKEVKHGKPNS